MADHSRVGAARADSGHGLSRVVRAARKRLDRGVLFADRASMRAAARSSATARVEARAARRGGEVLDLLRSGTHRPVWDLPGERLRVRFVGPRTGAEYLAASLGLSDSQIAERSPARMRRLARGFEGWVESDADTVVAQVPALFPCSEPDGLSFSTPVWVDMVVDLPTDPTRILARRGSRTRRKIRAVQRQGFTAAFTRDPSRFHEFYDKIYIPWIAERFNPTFHASSSEQCRWWFDRGGLLEVRESASGRAVAGQLMAFVDRTCLFGEMGVNLALAGNGAMPYLSKFLHWSAFVVASERGYRTANLGGNRACMSDGAFVYKARWGARALPSSRTTQKWVVTARDTASARSWIDTMGFLALTGGHLARVTTGANPCPAAADTSVSHSVSTVHRLGTGDPPAPAATGAGATEARG